MINMNHLEKSLFQLMRFNVLSTAKPETQDHIFSPAYVYAWERGVYPLFNEGAHWHDPFKEQFSISEAEIDDVSKLLDGKWLQKVPITFYELESTYDVHGLAHSTSSWTRYKLISACRYMFLADLFDHAFWSQFVENGNCPSEALSLARSFEWSDIYLE